MVNISNITRSGLLSRDEQTDAMHSFGVEGLPPVLQGIPWSPVRVTTAATEGLNSIVFANDPRCQGINGAVQADCQVGYIPSDAAASSPGELANIIKSTNAGVTWAATGDEPFNTGENAGAAVAFPVDRNTDRIIVFRIETDAGNAAEGAYSDDGGDTWTKFDIGTVTGQFVTSAFALIPLTFGWGWMMVTSTNQAMVA